MRSEPVNVDDSTVVSEMGEQWSPKIAPEKTAPTMAATMVWLPANCQATLIPMGVTMLIVPHAVPVEKAMNADSRKISAGNIAGPTVNAGNNGRSIGPLRTSAV